MTRRLLTTVLAAAALGCVTASPASAVEYCKTVAPTFIDRWTYCVTATADPSSGTGSARVECDMGTSFCHGTTVVVTVP